VNGEARYKYSVEKIFEVTRLMNSDSDSAWNSLGQWSVPRTILATNVIRNFKVAGKTDNDELGSTLSELGINTGLELLVPEKVVWEWLNINTEHQLNINNDYQSADDYVDLIEESLKDAGLAYEIGDELDQDEIDELIENGQQVTKEFGSCDFGAEKLKKVNALVRLVSNTKQKLAVICVGITALTFGFGIMQKMLTSEIQKRFNKPATESGLKHWILNDISMTRCTKSAIQMRRLIRTS